MVDRSSIDITGFRIIPSRYPSIWLFEDVSNPEEFDALYKLESMTNPRISEEVGDITLLSKDEQVFGEGTSPIMAAFTHIKPEGDRFTDGSFGAFYASDSIECAVYETAYHRAQYFASINEPPCEIEMRVYTANIQGALVDIRDLDRYGDYHNKDSYGESQRFGREQKDAGEFGIVYLSVRYDGGTNVAVFRPKGVINNCKELKYLKYQWDGKKITNVYEISGARVICYRS
ncbi:RES family NAD+ phosphorylase [Limisalsivibrio acetivorans]|uniref:RES family NAD+ phosphorylase n=1 Tax=Limisalsivibrio acetivorans TaxID=1304888 RepID=UPI0003B680C3|nr:RES family NAD+ phosphorylase [Limisalsivibrio acetivorans]